MNFSSVARHLLDLLIPPRTTDMIVRALELDELRAILHTEGDRSSLPYHDPRVRALVWELKYFAHARASALAGTLLAEILLKIASENPEKPLLIPVPMHSARRRERGHNQTEVLCEATLIHTQTYFSYNPRALMRIKATPQQQGLDKHQREHNPQRSMEVVDIHAVQNRVCVVVDDVSTTGATFAEAARALREAGAAKVICVALAYS